MLVISELNDEDSRKLEQSLHHYDYLKTEINNNKTISYGFYDNKELVAGINAKLEGYNILYIETLFVDANYRSQKLGTKLMKLIEERAIFEGAKTIRLDTFSFQAKDFYLKLGYKIIGEHKIDDQISEYFLIKNLYKKGTVWWYNSSLYF